MHPELPDMLKDLLTWHEQVNATEVAKIHDLSKQEMDKRIELLWIVVHEFWAENGLLAYRGRG